jgi:hypothetical protein
MLVRGVLIALLLRSVQLSAGKIVLRIFPARKFSYEHPSAPKATLFFATLEGFAFAENQVELVDHNQTFVGDGRELYNSQKLMEALLVGRVNNYPLMFHKKLNYLRRDDQLSIIRYDNCKGIPVALPERMTERILHYLTTDFESTRSDCHDFFRAVLDVGHAEECAYVGKRFEKINSEQQVNPGDGIVVVEEDDDHFVLRHFVVALGNGLYLSKLGAANFIAAHDLPTIVALYKGDYAAKVSFIYPTKVQQTFSVVMLDRKAKMHAEKRVSVGAIAKKSAIILTVAAVGLAITTYCLYQH